MEPPVGEAAGRFGVIVVDEDSRVIDVQEKPKGPAEIPGKPGFCYAIMGNYIAGAKILREVLTEDAKDTTSSHDFGNDVIPAMIRWGELRVFAYNFAENSASDQERPYWVDRGTIDKKPIKYGPGGRKPRAGLYSWRVEIMTPPDKEPRKASTVDGGVFSF